jgi:E1-E2 ATPase
MNNVFYIFNITFFLAVVALSAVWLLYRAARLRRFPVPFTHDNDRSVSPARSKNTTPRWRQSETQEAAAVDVHADDMLLFRPMRTHPVGVFCYGLCCLVSLQILALYLVFLIDYYAGCQLKSIDNLCFYGTHFLLGSYMQNGTDFFVVWCISVVWYTGWVLCKGRVINWFRMPVATRDATHVIVWSPETVEVVSLFVSPVVRAVRRLRAAITPAWARGSFKTVPVVTSPVSGQRYFVFEGLRFLLDAPAGSLAGSSVASKAAVNGSKNGVIPDRALEKLAPDYVPPSAPGITHARYTVATSTADLHALASGLTADAVVRVRDMVGSNACPFRPASFRELLVDEFFSLFHVYQLVQYVLMFWFSYLFVAAIMSTAVLISAAVSMLLVHNAQVAVERVANVTSRVRVRRDGAWVDVDSADLVPGDVVKLGAGERVPCDVVVIDGTCVVDESSLTGESLPCIKSAAPNDATYLDVHYPPPRHTLFDGTIVRQAGKHADDGVTAVVIATGMATTKGDLLAAILFPARMVFKYDEELAVVIVILLAYSVLCFSLSIVFQGYAGTKSDWITKWIYATAITSQILSPLLPVALEVGQIHAMERLKRRGINCLQPKRIMISGKTRVQAFDKTGTLTKDGLDFIGFHPAAAAADALTLLPATAVDPLAQVGLATCHSAEKCADVIVASEVEFKMFEATGWLFTSADGATPVVLESPAGASYTVLQRNDFDNTRQTQSVVVQGPTGECDIFVKVRLK